MIDIAIQTLNRNFVSIEDAIKIIGVTKSQFYDLVSNNRLEIAYAKFVRHDDLVDFTILFREYQALPQSKEL